MPETRTGGWVLDDREIDDVERRYGGGAAKHLGPGEHPSGTPQSVHGGGVATAEPSEDVSPFHSLGDLAYSSGAVGGGGKTGWLKPDGDEVAVALTPGRLLPIGATHREMLARASSLEPYEAFNEGWIRFSSGPKMLAVEFATTAAERAIGLIRREYSGQPILVDLWFNRIQYSESFDDPEDGDKRAIRWIREQMQAADERRRTTRAWGEWVEWKHLGPGDHPSGSPQAVHGGDGGGTVPLDGEGSPLEDLNGTPARLNADGTLTLYHATSNEAADEIVRRGFRNIHADARGEVFFSTAIRGQAAGFGDHVVEVHLAPRQVRLDDAFRDGELHVAVPVRRIKPTDIVRVHSFRPDGPATMDIERRYGGGGSKHLGPGDHPSGSPQSVHGGENGGVATAQHEIPRPFPAEAELTDADWGPGDLAQRAIERFGTTDDFDEAGYVLPDGTMLNFHRMAVYRTAFLDHRQIAWLLTSEGRDRISHLPRENDRSSALMSDFMRRTGAIRVNFNGIHARTMPTEAQVRPVVEGWRRREREGHPVPHLMPLDATGRGSVELPRPTVSRVMDAFRALFGHAKHYGPGEHPGGSPQSVHGGDGAATATAEVGHEAQEFYTPNIREDLTFEQASAALHSPEQARFAQVARRMDRELGLQARVSYAVGDTKEWGSEPSLVTEIEDAPDFETIRYSAAKKGLIGWQKSVIPFIEEAGGPDRLYMAEVPGSRANEATLRTLLNESGLDYRTFVPTATGTRVLVLSIGGDYGDTERRIAAFAERVGTPIHVHEGRGEFLGADTRADAQKIFARVIHEYERVAHPRRAQAAGVRRAWVWSENKVTRGPPKWEGGRQSTKLDQPYDVLFVEVISPSLDALHARLAGALDHSDDHPLYVPHVTLAYMKPGTAQSYIAYAPSPLEGAEATFDAVNFHPDPETPIPIRLDGEKHLGPGDHPSGSPQAVHGGDGGSAETGSGQAIGSVAPRGDGLGEGGGHFESQAAYAAVAEATHRAWTRRGAALDQAAKAKTRSDAREILNAARQQAQNELTDLIATHGVQAGQVTLLANRAAVEATMLLNEHDALSSAWRTLEDETYRTWRKDMREYWREPYLEFGNSRIDGSGYERIAVPDQAYYAHGAVEWRAATMRGPGASSPTWTADELAAVKGDMAGLPAFDEIRPLVLLTTLTSLDEAGARSNSPVPEYTGIIAVHASARGEDARQTVLHELGHEVQSALIRAYGRRTDFERWSDPTYTAGDAVRAMEADHAALAARSDRASRFRLDTGGGRSWGGPTELFSEDFATTFSGRPTKRFFHEKNGNVEPLTPQEQAAFRTWVVERTRHAPLPVWR